LITVELINVWVYYGDKSVLKGISAKFTPGVHVILGRNGAGKTTLLRAIARLVEFRGEIIVMGKSVKGLKRRDLAKLVGYCWQNPYYGFIEATVRDEIRAILDTLRLPGNWEVVKLLVPEELMERDPSTLSGGEAKRVSMASILIADQPIWLLDDPFMFLDKSGVDSILRLVEYGRSRGKTIIATMHEVFYASLLKPDTYIILDQGIISSSGEWWSLSDDVLEKAGIVPRGEICASICTSRGIRL